MVDVLLEALGLVAGGNQGAGLPGGAALLNPKKVFKLHIKIKRNLLKKQEKDNGKKCLGSIRQRKMEVGD